MPDIEEQLKEMNNEEIEVYIKLQLQNIKEQESKLEEVKRITDILLVEKMKRIHDGTWYSFKCSNCKINIVSNEFTRIFVCQNCGEKFCLGEG